MTTCCIKLFFALCCAPLVAAQFEMKIAVKDEPDPWLVDLGENNTVTLELTHNIVGELLPNEAFGLEITDCGDGSDYTLLSSTSLDGDDGDGPSFTFKNDVNIKETTFCAEAILTFGDEKAATFIYNMTVESQGSGENEIQGETPRVSVQINPTEDSQIGEIVVIRDAPPITLTVLNDGPFVFGQMLQLQATSPSVGYEFTLLKAEIMGSEPESSYNLTIVNGGPGAAPVDFVLSDFQVWDFVGTVLTVTFSIRWEIVTPGRRRLRPDDYGYSSFVLEIDLQSPQDSVGRESSDAAVASSPMASVWLILVAGFLV